MKKHPHPIVLVFATGLALAGLALNSGCVAVAAGAAGAGAVAYVRGELVSPLEASFDHSLSAAQKAVEQLKFAKVSEKQDALIATLVARNADDKRIEVRVETAGANRAKVKIRVGILGDQLLSMAILDKIKGNL